MDNNRNTGNKRYKAPSGYSKRKKAINKRKSARYRRLQLYYNMIFAFVLVFMIIFGAMHVFTKKKALRKEGLEYYDKGEYEAAIESFNKALKCKQWFSDSIDVDIEMYKADCYIRLSDYSDAERVYSSIKTKYPEKYYDKDKIEFLEELSNAMDRYKYGDYVSTVGVFNRAVEEGYPEMSIYSANCYEQSGNYEKMKESLDIYTASLGYTADICYKYASYYMALNDYDNALTFIEQGITYGEGVYYQEFLYARIICNEKKGDFEKAFGYASDYITAYPDDSMGADIYAWLDTRINPDTEVINDIFDQNGKTDENESIL